MSKIVIGDHAYIEVGYGWVNIVLPKKEPINIDVDNFRRLLEAVVDIHSEGVSEGRNEGW